MSRIPMLLLLCGIGSIAGQAQDKPWDMSGSGDKWEISGVAGGSLFRDVEAKGTTPPRTVKAGFFNGVAVGVVLSQTGAQHWGGEFHYLFQTNDMRLRAGQNTSGSANFSAQSHSFHYDAVLYATRRDAHIRPFIAAGPGLRVYQATGTERAFTPLSDTVVFSRQNDLKFLVSAGGGVKVRFGPGIFRVDVRDYVTGIPKNFSAVPGAKLSGQFHNFVATAGVGISF